MPDSDKPHDYIPSVDDAVASRGLLSVLNDVGHPTMQDPDKHAAILHAARAHHMALKEFPGTPKPRSLGGKLGHHIASGEHDKAAELISGHPLTGLVGKSHMKSIMSHMAEPAISHEPHPKAFRSAVDYLASGHRGKDIIDSTISGLFAPESKMSHSHNPVHIKELKEKIDSLTLNPATMLEIGGDLGHYLPEHNVQVAALSANAVQYLASLKPTGAQESPLDPVLPPGKAQMSEYDRQVGIAQNPLITLQHARKGTLLPADMATLQTVYPKLHQSIVNKVGQQLIDAKDKGTKIPYQMRSSLSLLLGQPLDSTMTSTAMQSIMKANGGAQQGPGSNQNKAPATALKAADKANKMLDTPLQKREINKKA